MTNRYTTPPRRFCHPFFVVVALLGKINVSFALHRKDFSRDGHRRNFQSGSLVLVYISMRYMAWVAQHCIVSKCTRGKKSSVCQSEVNLTISSKFKCGTFNQDWGRDECGGIEGLGRGRGVKCKIKFKVKARELLMSTFKI